MSEEIHPGFKPFMRFIVIPFMVLILAITVLFVMDMQWVAQLVGLFGPVLILAVAFVYIIAFDSKKRWPNLTAWQRWSKVMTFQR